MIRDLLQRRRFMREHRWTHARLSQYLDGEIPPAERARMEEHLRICPQCSRVLATLRRMLEGLHALRAEPTPSVADGVIARLRDEG